MMAKRVTRREKAILSVACTRTTPPSPRPSPTQGAAIVRQAAAIDARKPAGDPAIDAETACVVVQAPTSSGL